MPQTETPDQTADMSIPATGRHVSRRRWKWILVAFVFLTVEGLDARCDLHRIEEQSRGDAGSSLTVVVDTIQDSLREWCRAERDYAVRLARRPEVVEATRALLEISLDPISLRATPQFQSLRELNSSQKSSEGKLGNQEGPRLDFPSPEMLQVVAALAES